MVARQCCEHYFGNNAEQLGISNVRPLPGYLDILPTGAPVGQIAYHFNGDFEAASYGAPALMREIQGAVDAWRQQWAAKRRPELRVGEHRGVFVLVDTRGLGGTDPVELLDPVEAGQLVAGQPYDDGPDQRALIARKLAVRLDGWFVPLAVVDQAKLALINEALPAPLVPSDPQQPVQSLSPA